MKRKNYWYSLEDNILIILKSRSKSMEFKINTELEKEAIREFYEKYETPEEPEYLETIQEIIKSTGIVVRVLSLPELKKDKYIIFLEEWFKDESDKEKGS
jgi:hypothetical protein